MSANPAALSAVREMPEHERPRERLARLGPEALRDAELLAILFRTGTRDEGAVALAERVLKTFRDLRGLARASSDEVRAIKGVGPVKAIELQAALELGMRLAQHQPARRVRIHGAAEVSDLLMTRFKAYETECMKAVLLNTRHEVMAVVDVSKGGLDGTVASPRDVFRQAVRENAAAIIVAHNHPSGDPEPSRTDLELTVRLKDAGTMLGIPLLDHIIFGEGRYVSLKERNYC